MHIGRSYSRNDKGTEIADPFCGYANHNNMSLVARLFACAGPAVTGRSGDCNAVGSPRDIAHLLTTGSCRTSRFLIAAWPGG